MAPLVDTSVNVTFMTLSVLLLFLAKIFFDGFWMGEGGHQFSLLLLLSTVSLLFSFTLKLYDVKGGKKYTH